MPESELRLQRLDPLPRFCITLVSLVNLHNPVVIGVTNEASHTVRGDFLLEVNVRNWRPIIVRVKRVVCRNMAQLDPITGVNILEWLEAPSRVGVRSSGRINNPPIVI